MLEVAFLNSHLLWFTTREDMEVLYDMVTKNAAKCIGVKDFEIKVGAPANLVVLDQPNVLEALRFHERPTHVISHGKLVDQAKMDKIYSDNF
jgi:cytosine deaminase